MKRCRHRCWGKCYLKSSVGTILFIADHIDENDYFLRRSLTCDDAMANICDLRDATPQPKQAPENPRSQWLKCPYCTSMHKTEKTAATCKFYHLEFKALRETEAYAWLPEGSREPWPPYGASLDDSNVWHSMVDKIIARDGNCCTDCGISATEVGIIIKGYVPVPYVIGQPWVDTRWSDAEAWHDLKSAQSQHTREAQKQLPGFEVHHIIPRCQGGTHHPHNLRMLCSTCHRTYTNELMGDLAEQRRVEKNVAVALDAIADCDPIKMTNDENQRLLTEWD